jgi:lipopolysaccharide transport system ATP-binding protein
MKPAIKVESLSKIYRIGERTSNTYRTLRDSISESVTGSWNGLRRLINGSRKETRNGSLNHDYFWALKDVSFEVKPGEVMGIIGRNGAGKSTLLKILSRITEPTRGRCEIRGRMASLLEVGTGFHPELTGRENIFLNGSILGMRRKEITQKFDEIVAFSEIEKFLDMPVKRYSSGMYVRLAFAVAAHLDPTILLVDEVLAVGDVQFQKKCLGKMQDIGESGRTIFFVSHNMQAIRQLCSRTILIDKGSILYDGTPGEAIACCLGKDEKGSGIVDLDKVPRISRPSEAVLTKIHFCDESGQPKDRFCTDKRLFVHVYVKSKRQLDALDLAMAVVHREGIRVFSETYSDQEAPIQLVAGEYRFVFSFDLKYLRSDQYYLAFNLSNGEKGLEHIEGIPMPEIVDVDPDPIKEAHRWGVVRIPINWAKPFKVI